MLHGGTNVTDEKADVDGLSDDCLGLFMFIMTVDGLYHSYCDIAMEARLDIYHIAYS